MKANELNCKDLMIGDWVSYYKPDTELAIGRIKKLNVNKYLDGDDEIEVVDSKGCWMTIPNINELQPIPLSDEILERMGFHKETYDVDEWWTLNLKIKDDIFYNHASINVEQKSGRVFGVWDVDVKFFESGRDAISYTGSIDYVHTLQHIVRCCFIEHELVIKED